MIALAKLEEHQVMAEGRCPLPMSLGAQLDRALGILHEVTTEAIRLRQGLQRIAYHSTDKAAAALASSILDGRE